jgi:ABC-type sugar transport system ATPase subunit
VSLGLSRNVAAGNLSRRHEQEVTAEMIRRLNIKTPRSQVVHSCPAAISKRWFRQVAVDAATVLLLDEPTRDRRGAKEEIYELMEGLAKTGVAILFVSSEMEEIMACPTGCWSCTKAV